MLLVEASTFTFGISYNDIFNINSEHVPSKKALSVCADNAFFIPKNHKNQSCISLISKWLIVKINN